MADDYADDASTTGVLLVDGTPTFGVLETPDDVDWLRIDAEMGETIRVELASAAFVTCNIAIVDEWGNVWGTYSGPSAGANLTFGASTVGRYFVQVIGFDELGNFTTGPYSFTALPVPDDHGDTFATATEIFLDGPFVSSINEGGDKDMFRFRAEAGQPWIMDFDEFPSGGVEFRVYDQYGRQVHFVIASAASGYYIFDAVGAGDYYIEFFGKSEPTTFQLVTPVDDYSDTLPTNGVLVVDGGPVHGRHDFTDDLDVFSINIDEAGTYRFEISPLDPFRLWELIALYDAEGNLITSRVAAFEGEGLTLHVDAPGQYYLGVLQANGVIQDLNLYTVTAYQVTDDFGDTLATSGDITIDGGVLAGAINYNEDIDLLSFEYEAGDVLRIDFTTAGFAARSFIILNDEGEVYTWFNDSEYDNNIYYFSARESGVFYFSVGDPMGGISYVGTGTYNVRFSTVPGESSLPDALTIGTPANGMLTHAGGDNDLFEFTALAGQTIRFDVDADYNWYLWIWSLSPEGVQQNLVIEPLAGSRATGYTFSEDGTYYIAVRGAQATAGGTADLGAYTLHSEVIADDPAAGAPLTLDGTSVGGTVHYENDTDYFALTVEAGDVVRFSIDTEATVNWGVTGFGSRSAIGGTTREFIQRFDTAGTYYLTVSNNHWEEVGDTFTVKAETFFDDHLSSVDTDAVVTVGGAAFVGQFEYNTDNDWIAVELEAGVSYRFTIAGVLPGLNGAIDIYNDAGVLLDTTGLSVGSSTEIIFTAETAGTFYLGASRQNGSVEAYTVTAAIAPPVLLEAINPGFPGLPQSVFGHTHVGPSDVIQVYFAGAGDTFDAIVSDGWLPEEIAAVMQIFDGIENYLNVTFQITDLLVNADMALTTFADPDTITLFSRAHEEVPIPVVAFSYPTGVLSPEALTPGGLGAAVVLNGIGYALGLTLPHHAEGDSVVMEGVEGELDTGAFDLNQGVYTIMSFNDGWVTSPFGVSPSFEYGWQATPMALDFAVLRGIYGANTTRNAGDTSYALSAMANARWELIWDVGGADTIAYSGAGAAHIDLRSATLAYGQGGGGFLSYVEGAHGGFTIANGAVIERATGGNGNDTLIGNSASNILTGGAGANSLTGGGGSDTASYSGSATGVTVNLQTGAASGGDAAGDTFSSIENITGSNFADTLTGNSGANVIEGAGGVDTMKGGSGDDSYGVDTVGDVVTELSNGGTDQVNSRVNYTLGANVENLSLRGTGNLNGTGNALNNVLTGNSGANILDGKAGADAMSGGAGDDVYGVDNVGDIVTEAYPTGGVDQVNAYVSYNLGANIEKLSLRGSADLNGAGNALANTLNGNSGANILDGRTGVDIMSGGDGNDTYYVDNKNDVVKETATGGADRINATTSYTLSANVELLSLRGTANINATGNDQSNTLGGNNGNNILDGKVGADTMVGAGGDDTYGVDNAGDVVTESAGGGIDQVNAHINYTLGANVENLSLRGSANLSGAGNALNNIISGGAGANTLNGGLGLDTLTGGAGADAFVFNTALSAGNRDTITDFRVLDDVLHLENGIFTALSATGVLDAAAFHTGAAAHDATDRVIYNSVTGALLYDADGNGGGAAIQFATLSASLALTNADVLVI